MLNFIYGLDLFIHSPSLPSSSSSAVESFWHNSTVECRISIFLLFFFLLLAYQLFFIRWFREINCYLKILSRQCFHCQMAWHMVFVCHHLISSKRSGLMTSASSLSSNIVPAYLARQKVELLHHKTPEFIAPDMWPQMIAAFGNRCRNEFKRQYRT